MTTTTMPSTERRATSFGLRASPTKPGAIEGYAAVFGSPSVDLGFTEILARGCFANALVSSEDVLMLWGHDVNAPLARRSAGSLTLTEDATGLRFTALLSDTQAGRDALTLIRDGVIKGCSFGFTVARDTWGSTPDGNQLRTIHEIGRLLEVTLTASPAYPATSVEARNRRRPSTAKPTPYGPESRHSYFADLAAVATSRALQQSMRDEVRDGWPSRVFGTGRGLVGDTRDALQRLQSIERRDVTTSDPGAGAFVPTGAPVHVAQRFAIAVRAKAKLAMLLPTEPLPPYGMTVQVGKITTGANVAVQATQNAALTETDIDTDTPTSPVATIAGFVDTSLQAFDRAGNGYELDMTVAADLGDALATDFDRQLITGTGTGGQLAGLLTLAGTTSTAYTDATPTIQELWAQILACRSAVATALGSPPTVVLWHPRRGSWATSQRDTAGQAFRIDIPGTTIVECPTVPTNLGAGTNEDPILLLEPSELPIAPGAIRFEVLPEVGSASGTVRLRAYQYAASLTGRRPEAVGKLSGTGLTPPVFT